MSPPAFLDSSAGQFSSFGSSSQLCFCYNTMQSSTSNSNAGFSNSNETNPVLRFNSPPLAASRKPGAASGSGSNLSRPRLVKMRKQSSHNPRSTNPATGSRVAGAELGPGFNKFQSSSESFLESSSSGNVAKVTFLFGANRGNNLSSYSGSESGVSGGSSNVIVDDMRKLNIGSDKDHANATGNNAASNLKVFRSENKEGLVDDSVVDELPTEISKLNIEGTSNVGSPKNSQGVDPINKSQFTSFVNGNLVVELQNKMNKMNLKYPGDIYVGSNRLRGSVLGQNSMAGDSLPVRSDTVHPGSWCNEEEAKAKLISDGMRELKLSGSKEASGSSTVFDNELQNDVSQGKNLSATGDAMDHPNIKTEVDDTTSSSKSSSFTSSQSQSFRNASSMSGSEKKVAFAFTSKLGNMGTPHVEFRTPDMKSSLFSGMNIFEAKKESAKATRSKKKKGKLKKPIVGPSRLREDFGFSGRSSPENPDSSEAYSPMDISPYHETLADNYSRETSVTPEEASQINDQNNDSGESYMMNSNVTTDDDLLDAVQCLDISDGDVKSSVTKKDVFEPHVNEVSETESFKSATENWESSSDTFVTTLDSEVSSTATSRRQESTAMPVFNFASKSESISKDGFTFAASSSSQCQHPPDTRQHKKKHRLKTVHDSYSSTSDVKSSYIPSPSAEFFPISGNSSILSPGKGQKADISTLLNTQKDNSKPVREQDVKHETVITSSASNMAQEACEKWRLRGNQAYSNGDLAKAEDYYTQGLNSVSESEKSRSCLRALMLCYSNRAAARISLGRIREALKDCLMAATIDPNFIKVQVRAACCYLAIGEVENATQHFMKCLQSGTDGSVDRKLIAEASEGLEKAKKVSDCIKQYTDLSQRRTSEDWACGLRSIDEALQISTYSDKLLQMKADCLLMLRRYEQVIQVCEQTLGSAEVDTPTSSSSRLWRSCLIVKSYFYLGRLDEALEFIKKQENSVTERVGGMSQESVMPLAETICELLSHKAAGNEAYKSGKHAEAVEHYTAALSCNVESRPFAAICFCNRAAAYRALGQITDAIADCSLAIALDPNYLKAISRRARLYEMIRDYGQAVTDLQRLVSLLTTQVEEKGAPSGVSDKLSCMNELRQTQLWLSNVEEESRKGIPLNMYLILGIESTASAPDIKKAYRKAALKHHPDKAAQSLNRSDNGDDGLWKEIVENVHKDADRLFKMIGEAYAVLSNPAKRSQYDLDEEMRNEANRFTRTNSSRMAADVQNSVFERSGNQHQWQDSWRPYVNTQSKGSEKTGSSYRYSRYT